jgi:uncharacterized membrane protein YfcA
LVDFIYILLDTFLVSLLALGTTSGPFFDFENPISISILVILGFIVGIAIGASGIGGAALIVPSLLFLGLPPQTMVGASLFFNFFSNILGSILHAKKGNVNRSALIYTLIPVIPSMLLASLLWKHIKSNYGSSTLDTFILLPIGILLVGIAVFMIRGYMRKKKGNLSSNTAQIKPRMNLMKRDKGILLCVGGFVSFLIQISSVGAGVIVTPVLLKILHSPKHAAGTTVTFGLVVSFIGTLLYSSLGDISADLVIVLLAGSIPGVILGVKITTVVSSRTLTLIFSIIILAAGILVLSRILV